MSLYTGEVPLEYDVDRMSSEELNTRLTEEKTYKVVGTPEYDQKPKELLKQDTGKLRYDLFPVEALEEITKVLNFGAEKYAPRAWEKGMKYGRLYAALFRHMTAWWKGEDLDKETNISHLAHAGCCVIFLLTYAKRGLTEHDDRPRPAYTITPRRNAI